MGDGFLLFEDTVDPGKRTPLHTHPAADETFYLLAGSMLLHVDGVDSVDFDRIRQAATSTGSMTIVGPPPF